MIIQIVFLATFFAPPCAVAKRINKKLVAIAWRESRCRAVGRHKIDGWMEPIVYRRAVRAGILQPGTCEHHAPGRWSTSGPFGMVRAYSLQYVDGNTCFDPKLLDHPVMSAIIANRRYEAARSKNALTALRRWAKLAHEGARG